jgi:3,4-dihydroxy 2-butanone 4-phosphate synthase/GTP cyclohydrolase II
MTTARRAYWRAETYGRIQPRGGSSQIMAELTIIKKTSARVPTAEGEFQLSLYISNHDDKEHLVLIIGDVTARRDILVRVHSECFTGDVLGSLRCDCGGQLHQSMHMIAEAGTGILIYLRQEGRGIGIVDKLRAYNLQDMGYDTVDANLLLGHKADERDYTAAALILKDLGVLSVRLLTNNPLKIESLRALGISVNARVPLPPHITVENAAYLRTKVERMRHLLHLASPFEARGDRLHNLETLPARAAVHRQRTGRPFVTLTYAQSLDGSIAADPGQPLPLSGPQSLLLTHCLRAAHDAILVGIGTVLADNPLLNVRLIEGKDPQPVIVDSRLRFPLEANLLRRHPLTPWIATSDQADGVRQRQLEAAGARVLRLPPMENGEVDLAALLQQLGTWGINSLMVEGGARIITSFLARQLADHLVLTVVPRLVGGVRAVGNLGPLGLDRFPGLRNIGHQWLGEDLVLWGDLAWGKA